MRIDAWRRRGNGTGTHLLLDGGILHVNENQLDAFYDAYASDIADGYKLYVVEKKTNPNFRFFVDIDYTGDTPLDFKRVVEEISKIVWDDVGSCFVAKAEPRITSKGLTKYGIHMVWNESVVNKKIANSLRLKILDELGYDDWEKIIDSSVYAGSGLRMLWSLKNEDGSTPYVPWGRISEKNGSLVDLDVTNTPETLKLFSIRTRDESVSVETTSSNTGDLENYIRSNLPGQSNARIVKVQKCKNKVDYWIGTTSRYCHNVQREHKSNHVWFLLRPGSRMIAQKCQDDECKEYTGRFYRIPSSCLIPNEGVLDTRAHRTIYDYLPDGWKKGDRERK